MSADLELYRTVFSGLTLASIAIAFFSYIGNRKKQNEDREIAHDKEIMSQAVQSLEWAFGAIIAGSEEELPPADRLNWLTAARHIQRYYSLRELLKTEMYTLLCSEHEEYWRHRFYLLLDKRELSNANYFIDASNDHWPENIEIRSAMIVSIFSQWDEETVDPVDSVRKDELEEKNPYRGMFGRGLQNYVERMQRSSKVLRNREQT